jgi:hypothetical protein
MCALSECLPNTVPHLASSCTPSDITIPYDLCNCSDVQQMTWHLSISCTCTCLYDVSCMHRYWQCLPKTGPAPAPAPLASTGRRLQAAGLPARAPEPSIIGPSPGPQPAAKTVLPGSRAPIYDLCGGAGLTCPLANKTLCKDSQYLDCVPNTHCVRLSQWYVHLPIL